MGPWHSLQYFNLSIFITTKFYVGSGDGFLYMVVERLDGWLS